MTVKEPSTRSFWVKNLGPVERMIWALIGLVIMSVGFKVFNALNVNAGFAGPIIVLIGFLVFLQAPMAWSLMNALSQRSTFERDPEASAE